ncbi:putative ribonuclease H-like domain-containing protein [Tanacetum coccineum]
MKTEYTNSSNGINIVSTPNNLLKALTLPPVPNISSMDNTGIFGNAYDDEDVEEDVDMNNVISSYRVPDTSFTKFHKDHPEDQVIGSLKTPVQTRHVTKINEEHARLVGQGHTQEEGIDYDEVFAPVARIEAIRLFLAYASFKDFVVYQMDVKSAFLYGKIEEEVYVYQPPSFEDPHFLDKFYKVEKALYGLHQAPRAWNKDDILLVQVKQKSDGIFISQDKYVVEILKKFNFASVKTASTLMETNKALIKDEEAEDVDVHLYRSMIGSLMYLTASRPDIMFVVCACTRFQVTPKTSHFNAVKRIFRYLKGQPKLGLWYPRDSPFDLEAYSDSDYAGASLDRKSTTGGKSKVVRTPRYLSLVVPLKKVGDEDVHKELGDRMERAATTASSLEAEQDSGFTSPSDRNHSLQNRGGSLLALKCLVSFMKYYANVRKTVVDFSHAPLNEYSPSPDDKKQWSLNLLKIRMLVWGKLIQKLHQKGVYEESFLRHAAWIGGKLIQFMHTTMVQEQVKTMKIQAGIQVLRRGELRRQLQLWKRFGRLYYVFFCSGLRCQDTILGDVDAQTRYQLVLPVQVPVAKERDGFAEIIDFLKASSVHYALTVIPIIYTSYIQQFWATPNVKMVNVARQFQALIDKKKMIITESSIRSDLHLEDAAGTDCLPTTTIFEELRKMGAKSTTWNEFSSTMASLIICLATNQKFNLSKYIFDAMVKHLDRGVKVLLYPRFLQVFINQQLGDMSHYKKIYVNPSHIKKIANMKRAGKDFYGRITPLFDTMMVQASEEVGADLDHPTDSNQIPIVDQPSTSSQPKKKQKSRRK